MSDYKYCIGIMSGTSLDGIDVALCKIRGHGLDTDIKLVSFETYSYSEDLLNDIKQSLDLSRSNAQLLCSLNFKLGVEYACAVKKLVETSKLSLKDIEFIANHGQTIYHQSICEGNFVKSSLQLGDAATIAYECQTTVVSNFRAGDIAAGGDGAPLVPYVDYILYRDKNKSRALHNIGGIANTTIIPKNANAEDVYAFDTGPGNMMINRAVEVLFDKHYDEDGLIAKQGRVILEMLEELLSNKYLEQKPPKSTGRELFGIEYTDYIIGKYKENSPQDIVHTLTIFTAESIVNAYKDFVFDKHNLDQIIFTGGGAYNKFLIQTIKDLLDIDVLTFEDIGENSDAKEAVAFAVLGNETLNRSYNNIPTATGAKSKVILGQINYFN
ncbi:MULTISPECIES: anhydro-N-acetylmuramic acid kinase AnmK [unclassified Francisella]|uniref:anhydro-N-acetylmuramic acid kinase AnmK n=1 Tax=unclassified Francisella TaxID=2610885 RepID=UPI002E34CE6D|nr:MULTISPECIES: anhydro-N-acetylmuramic acid kinase AnmK [unclassified Francisella]MED7818385.1 anhydro-N-acetylmuramic acid kinase AnmK [Francisella sp. 19S2-4]MED7829221.1 anhydro-N-acetylmuramic acid kinase AnmK [Francisella sp. 19S2-10]